MPNRLRRSFAPPIFADEEKTRVAFILHSFVWSAIGILLAIIIFRVIFWSENGYVPLLVLLAILIVLAGGQLMIRHGHVRGASIFLVGALWLVMTYQAWEADGIRDAAIIAYIVVISTLKNLRTKQLNLYMGRSRAKGCMSPFRKTCQQCMETANA